MKDVLNLETLQSVCRFLPASNLFFDEECSSTNQKAKEWAANGGNGTALFVAAGQSAGRGRMGKTFFSPAGSGVYFSLTKVLPTQSQNAVAITCAAAVATRNAILQCCGVDCKIKWVNDLLVDGKKICGILTETVTQGDRTVVIVGIGVNLRPVSFPEELAMVAGSLQDEKTPRVNLIGAIVQQLLCYFSTSAPKSWLEDYRRASCVIGKPITFLQNGVSTQATALAIEEDGGLLVETAQQKLVLRTGEITLRVIGS